MECWAIMGSMRFPGQVRIRGIELSRSGPNALSIKAMDDAPGPQRSGRSPAFIIARDDDSSGAFG